MRLRYGFVVPEFGDGERYGLRQRVGCDLNRMYTLLVGVADAAPGHAGNVPRSVFLFPASLPKLFELF